MTSRQKKDNSMASFIFQSVPLLPAVWHRAHSSRHFQMQISPWIGTAGLFVLISPTFISGSAAGGLARLSEGPEKAPFTLIHYHTNGATPQPRRGRYRYKTCRNSAQNNDYTALMHQIKFTLGRPDNAHPCARWNGFALDLQMVHRCLLR